MRYSNSKIEIDRMLIERPAPSTVWLVRSQIFAVVTLVCLMIVAISGCQTYKEEHGSYAERYNGGYTPPPAAHPEPILSQSDEIAALQKDLNEKMAENIAITRKIEQLSQTEADHTQTLSEQAFEKQKLDTKLETLKERSRRLEAEIASRREEIRNLRN